MTVLVFANGELNEREWIKPRLAAATAVIAADGGLAHLLALGHWPNVLIGDMDSLPDGVDGALPRVGVEVVTFSQDKNETDLELALLYAVEHYPDPIEIYGAIGGRLDHTLANLSLLSHPALADRDVRIVELREEVWLVRDRTEITGEIGDTVSLLPVSDDVLVCLTTGLRWPLRDESLTFGRARGVSNELVESLATVEIAGGQLLCVHVARAKG